MKTYKKQLLSIFATGALLLNTVTPVFAGTTIVISGNGAGSENEAEIEIEQSTQVVQNNFAEIENDVEANASTGDNKAEENTGGDVSIDTGDASTDVIVKNTVNSNSASVDCCGTGDVDVLIEGNGANSENEVELEVNDEGGTGVFQSNKAEVENDVDAESETGGNEAEENTGGTVEITTGAADTSVKLSTSANANWATVGGGEGEGATLSMRILGNGANSENEIELEVERSLELVQDNYAEVENDVDAEAETGDNEVEENTGGEAIIDTGDADTEVTVDNMVNFNWADADCGCLFDVSAKIADNGVDTENEIEAELEDELGVFQGNCTDKDGKPVEDCEVENDLDAESETGDNKAEENGGGSQGDPSITTGDADTTVDVSNTGNSNMYGTELPDEWPEVDFNFNFSLSWEQLMELLGLSS